MDAIFIFDDSFKNGRNPIELTLDIIPRVGDSVDLDIFLTEKELESMDYDHNSGASHAIVKDVLLTKNTEGHLIYALVCGIRYRYVTGIL